MGTAGQKYGASRTQRDYYEQEQKVYPPERHGSVLSTLLMVFSALGLVPAGISIIACALAISQSNGSSALLTYGILGLIGSSVALLCLLTVFVLSLVSASSRAARHRQSRSR